MLFDSLLTTRIDLPAPGSTVAKPTPPKLYETLAKNLKFLSDSIETPSADTGPAPDQNMPTSWG
jgi:hypothetical protein